MTTKWTDGLLVLLQGVVLGAAIGGAGGSLVYALSKRKGLKAHSIGLNPEADGILLDDEELVAALTQLRSTYPLANDAFKTVIRGLKQLAAFSSRINEGRIRGRSDHAESSRIWLTIQRGLYAMGLKQDMDTYKTVAEAVKCHRDNASKEITLFTTTRR